MNIAGMVLGIIALVLAWIPFVGIISIPMVMVGLPLSFIGFRRSRRRGNGVGMAIAGLATNLIALSVIVLWLVFFGSLLTSSVESTT